MRIRWSVEPEPLETAGGIAAALPLLPSGPALIVSGDIWTQFDYASLAARAATMANVPGPPRVHFVMVPNPPFHPEGDFVLSGDRITPDGSAKLTFGNIALYDTALFGELHRGYQAQIAAALSRLDRAWMGFRERFDGPWANLGTPADLALLDARLSGPSR